MSDPVARVNAALEGRYRIESELGEGGMATVYLADDLKHERKVALKVLKPELAAVVGAERFLAEIKTTANLQHPHILPLHDSGEADGVLYYVMPLVDGPTLQDLIAHRRLCPEQVVPLFRDLLAGVGARRRVVNHVPTGLIGPHAVEPGAAERRLQLVVSQPTIAQVEPAHERGVARGARLPHGRISTISGVIDVPSSRTRATVTGRSNRR